MTYANRNQSPEPTHPPLNLSDDGYIRLTLSTLQQIPIYHLCSGLDEEQGQKFGTSAQGASRTEISGYTEWISCTLPALSIGWDWAYSHTDGRLVSRDQPYSNIMLLSSRQADLGQENTLALLAAWIETLNWQVRTQKYISQKYA